MNTCKTPGTETNSNVLSDNAIKADEKLGTTHYLYQGGFWCLSDPVKK